VLNEVLSSNQYDTKVIRPGDMDVGNQQSSILIHMARYIVLWSVPESRR
jgi:hypothetical protein